MTEALAIDFYQAVDDAPNTTALSGSVGVSWRGGGEWGPFADPKEGISTRLLPPDGHGFPEAAPRALPVWEPTDPLASLFRVWYGRYDVASKHGAHLSTWYGSTAETFKLRPDGEVPDLSGHLTPVTVTAAGLDYTGDGPGAMVVVIGDDPVDLVSLWNARATGGAVHPWPTSSPQRVQSSLVAWLNAETTRSRAHTFQTGDGSERGVYVGVTGGAGAEVVEEVVAFIEARGWRAFVHDYDHFRGWTGHHPVQTEQDVSFSISVGANDWQADLPFPHCRHSRAVSTVGRESSSLISRSSAKRCRRVGCSLYRRLDGWRPSSKQCNRI